MHLVFEDLNRNITLENLMPQEDEVACFAKKWAAKMSVGFDSLSNAKHEWTIKITLPEQHIGELKHATEFYYALLLCWFEQGLKRNPRRSTKHQYTTFWFLPALKGIARLHARLQEKNEKVQRTSLRSLGCLRGAFSELYSNENGIGIVEHWEKNNVELAVNLLEKCYWNGKYFPSYNIHKVKLKLQNLQPKSLLEACTMLADIIAEAGTYSNHRA